MNIKTITGVTDLGQVRYIYIRERSIKSGGHDILVFLRGSIAQATVRTEYAQYGTAYCPVTAMIGNDGMAHDRDEIRNGDNTKG
jgi:hypothetical protein